MGEDVGVGEAAQAGVILGVVGVAMGSRVVAVVEDAPGAGRVGVGDRGVVNEGALLLADAVEAGDQGHLRSLCEFGELAQPRGLAGKVPAHRHGYEGVDQALSHPGGQVVPHRQVARESGGRPDDEALAAALPLRFPVAGLADSPHPLGQRRRVLGDFAAGDEGGVGVEVDLDAVGGVAAQQLAHDRHAVLAHLGHREGQAPRVVELRLGTVRFLAHLPFGVRPLELGDAAVADAVVRGVVQVEQQVRQKAEAARLGVLADDHQRVVPGGEEGLEVLRGAVPDLVVGEFDVVPPALAGLGGVEEDGAVADDVADGVDAEIEDLVDRLDVLADAHRRLVQVDARVASVGLEKDLVLCAHLS